MAFPNTKPLPGDNPRNLLAKLLQLFGGSPTGDDGLPQLLRKILQAAVAANNADVSPPAEKGVSDQGDISGALQLDTANGEYQTFNATGDVQFTGITGLAAGQSLKVRFTNDGASTRTFTWTSNAADWHRSGSNQVQAGKGLIYVFYNFGTVDDDVYVEGWAF
jgi:hypothetical protein